MELEEVSLVLESRCVSLLAVLGEGKWHTLATGILEQPHLSATANNSVHSKKGVQHRVCTPMEQSCGSGVWASHQGPWITRMILTRQMQVHSQF
ncbi:hypothetical protein KY289_008944 [Solanum tuberosum]|nr:hypothetical protein KY289_008944 [Solanum tuberosum]